MFYQINTRMALFHAWFAGELSVTYWQIDNQELDYIFSSLLMTIHTTVHLHQTSSSLSAYP